MPQDSKTANQPEQNDIHLIEEKVQDYRASAPERPPWSLKKIALRIFFPPLLIWDLLKFPANFLFGRLIGGLVSPLGESSKNQKKTQRYGYKQMRLLSEEKKLSYQFLRVIIHDGAELDTLEINNLESADALIDKQKYIIHLTQSGQQYQEVLDEMLQESMTLQCKVIGFNLRGFGKGQGRAHSENDLVTDALSQVQRLL